MIDDQARALTTELLGAAPDALLPFRPTVGGDGSRQWRVTVEGRDLLLKVNRRPEQVIGIWYHGRLREAGVPVPELVAHSSTGGPEGQACAIFEWVDGEPAEFDCVEAPPYDEWELGALLRRIHSIAPKAGFGPLDDSGRAPCRDWSEAFVPLLHLGLCVRRGAITEALAERALRVAHRFADDLGRVEPRALHYEDIMWNGNVLVGADGRIAAVLDFSGAVAGDPLWELMWFDYYFGEYGLYPRTDHSFDFSRFRHAYGLEYDPHAPLQRLYLMSALLEKLSFTDLASERARSHRAMLEVLVRELARA
jgi:hypothetical protein